MTEFEAMMKSLVEEKDVPDELNLKLKKKIRAKYKYNKLVKAVPLSAVACIAVGIVLTSVMHNNQEVVGEKNVEQAVVAQSPSADTAQIEAYSGEEMRGIINESVLKQSTFERATLIDYLENNHELVDIVSQKVKERMSTDKSIDYFEDFTSVTGNENFYLTEENELVIIFEPGVVAAEENGEIYINVGVIK